MSMTNQRHDTVTHLTDEDIAAIEAIVRGENDKFNKYMPKSNLKAAWPIIIPLINRMRDAEKRLAAMEAGNGTL